MIPKEDWVNLAKAVETQYLYERDLDEAMKKIALDHGVATDFLGLPFSSDVLFEAVSKVLGEEWSYWFYECDRLFTVYNSNITYADGTHPNVCSLEDLYDKIAKEGALE